MSRFFAVGLGRRLGLALCLASSWLCVSAQAQVDPYPFAGLLWPERGTRYVVPADILSSYHRSESADGHIVVWHDARDPYAESRAKLVLKALQETKAWSKFESGLGRTPPPDTRVPGVADLGSGALDIVILRAEEWPPGISILSETVRLGAPTGARIPSRIVVWLPPDRALSASEAEFKSSVVHELFHAFQLAFFDVGEGDIMEPELEWLVESTAEFAAVDRYPSSSYPQRTREVRAVLENVNEPLPVAAGVPSHHLDRAYGSFLYWLAWTRWTRDASDENRFDVVRKVFERVSNNEDVATAMKKEGLIGCLDIEALGPDIEALGPDIEALGPDIAEMVGGECMPSQWHAANTYLWNKKNVSALSRDFRQYSSEFAPTDAYHVFMEGDHAKNNYPLPLPGGSLKPLSAAFFVFRLPKEARTVTFYDGFHGKLGRLADDDGTVRYGFLEDADDAFANSFIAVSMFARRSDSEPWQTIGQWLDAAEGPLSFCRDVKRKRVKDIGVLVTNSSIDKEFKYAGLPALFRFTNIGCWKWSGNSKMTHLNSVPGSGGDEVGQIVSAGGLVYQLSDLSIQGSKWYSDIWVDQVGGFTRVSGQAHATLQIEAPHPDPARDICKYEPVSSHIPLSTTAASSNQLSIDFLALSGPGARAVSYLDSVGPLPPGKWVYKKTCKVRHYDANCDCMKEKEETESLPFLGEFGSFPSTPPRIRVNPNGQRIDWRFYEGRNELSSGNFKATSE